MIRDDGQVFDRDRSQEPGRVCHGADVLVTPRPGIDRKGLLDNLRTIHAKASNLQGAGPGTAYDRLLAYLDWVNDTVSVLGKQVSPEDLNRLVLTRRYEQLLAGVGSLAGTAAVPLVNNLVSLEVRDRVDMFAAAITELNHEIRRWRLRGWTFVADSSFYIEHPQKLEEADLASLLPSWDDTVHLVVPIVVVDELDSLKQHKDRRIRWRAGYTLAVLDRLFHDGSAESVLRKADQTKQAHTGIRTDEITIELLFDPPGHVRLPINDDEIVDRALAVKARAGREVSLLTYDTGQATRGRFAGLDAKKLTKPQEDEPKDNGA